MKSGETPKLTIRERLTANAEQFDAIVTDLLAENESLRQQVSVIHASMNFDNLVEDAEKHGAQVSDSFSLHLVNDVGILFYEDELKSLLTQYILADRAASGEPIAEVVCNSAGQIHMIGGDGSYFNMSNYIGAKLFTRAQPTPAQIGNGWRQEDALLYVLKDGVNHFEVNVTMAHGSRDKEIRGQFAAYILEKLTQGEPL